MHPHILALLLAEKRGERYADVMGLLRCRFAFSIARSALICLRGSRSRFQGVSRDSLELPAHIVKSASTPLCIDGGCIILLFNF